MLQKHCLSLSLPNRPILRAARSRAFGDSCRASCSAATAAAATAQLLPEASCGIAAGLLCVRVGLTFTAKVPWGSGAPRSEAPKPSRGRSAGTPCLGGGQLGSAGTMHRTQLGALNWLEAATGPCRHLDAVGLPAQREPRKIHRWDQINQGSGQHVTEVSPSWRTGDSVAGAAGPTTVGSVAVRSTFPVRSTFARLRMKIGMWYVCSQDRNRLPEACAFDKAKGARGIRRAPTAPSLSGHISLASRTATLRIMLLGTLSSQYTPPRLQHARGHHWCEPCI